MSIVNEELDHLRDYMTVSITKAGDRDCRTIVAGHGPNTIFCGEPARPGKSYCAECCKRYFVKPEPPVRRRPKR